MAGLTSQQLNKILDLNAKSVEIYLEVEEKYNSILEEIEKINKEINQNKIDNTEHIKEQYLHIERMRGLSDRLEEIINDSQKNFYFGPFHYTPLVLK